jgi:hypothetical protein
MAPLFESGKDVLLGETGWPSYGNHPRIGSGSPESQTHFFAEFFCRMDKQLNWVYFYFTGIDDPWRQEQDPKNTLEGIWGFFRQFHYERIFPGLMTQRSNTVSWKLIGHCQLLQLRLPSLQLLSIRRAVPLMMNAKELA